MILNGLINSKHIIIHITWWYKKTARYIEKWFLWKIFRLTIYLPCRTWFLKLVWFFSKYMAKQNAEVIDYLTMYLSMVITECPTVNLLKTTGKKKKKSLILKILHKNSQNQTTQKIKRTIDKENDFKIILFINFMI